MPANRLRIAIVGCGTAGPAAATFLARQGHETVLFERAPRELPVGAGVLLQPTGRAVLRQLGLERAALEFAQPVDHLFCRTRSGRTLLDLRYEDLGQGGVSGLGTHRASLLGLLLSAAREAGVNLRWNTEITATQLDKSGHRILVAGSGEALGPYDLVLGCDGAKSALRVRSGLGARVDRYPWGALWFIGKRPAEFDSRTLWQCVDGTRKLAGFLPTGTDADLLSLFWSIRLDQLEEWKNQPLNVWKAEILRLAPQAETFLRSITDHGQLSTATYFDVRMKRWHAHRLAFLGDAAHALSPQLGQGVNLALMDAQALADSLASTPLAQGLAAYSRPRQFHVRFYQFATRWCTPFFQSDQQSLGTLRDFGFPLANQIPWARNRMTETMAGQMANW